MKRFSCPNGGRVSFNGALPSSSSKRCFSSSSSKASGLAVTVADLRPEVQHLHSQVSEQFKGLTLNSESKVTEFVREKVLPVEQELRDFYEQETWTIPAKHQQLQAEAKAAGLWNLFLPLETDPEAKFGAGLTNLEYAHLCEVLHVSPFVMSHLYQV